jgi:cyclase
VLAKRIIPCLDVEKGRVVKGTKFLDLVDAGDPVAVAARYESEGADELVFLDITASHEERSIMLDVVRRVSETVFMPFTVGGGIRTLDDACRLIQAGAEKVSINSAAVRTPELVSRVADRLGSCATVVNIDPKRVLKDGREIWEVFVSGGRVPTRLGAGEIVLTCMDRDGTRDGYDLEITAAVSRAVGIPVVASGGAGRPEHLADAITLGGADAALAAGIFHFGQCTIREVKELFVRRGITVRPPPT